MVLPEQPWLDGYCVEKGVIRQFVAARLGAGYTAEEQVHRTKRGGLQFEAIPCAPESYFENQSKSNLPQNLEDVLRDILTVSFETDSPMLLHECAESSMGLGAGGRMKQDIFEDPWELTDWELSQATRLWVHLCDAARWCGITGERPPQEPFTAKEYSTHGLPWFDYYDDDLEALKGSSVLSKLKTVFALAAEQGTPPCPKKVRSRPNQ